MNAALHRRERQTRRQCITSKSGTKCKHHRPKGDLSLPSAFKNQRRRPRFGDIRANPESWDNNINERSPRPNVKTRIATSDNRARPRPLSEDLAKYRLFYRASSIFALVPSKPLFLAGVVTASDIALSRLRHQGHEGVDPKPSSSRPE